MQIPGYRIIRKINQGGMSTVYLAIQLSVGREVALKVMSPALNADPVFSERFQREANIVGQLSHPHIVSIYDIGRFKNLNYIAMDYLAGGSIHDKMSTGLSANEALRITEEIANALDHAHDKGYIHRDIKPENILIGPYGEVLVLDWGLAKVWNKDRPAEEEDEAQTIVAPANGKLSGKGMTGEGKLQGTVMYMSPEQIDRDPGIAAQSDLYSLGAILYEILTGVTPFQGDLIQKLLTQIRTEVPADPRNVTSARIPDSLAELTMSCLKKDPQDRPASADDVLRTFREGWTYGDL